MQLLHATCSRISKSRCIHSVRLSPAVNLQQQNSQFLTTDVTTCLKPPFAVAPNLEVTHTPVQTCSKTSQMLPAMSSNIGGGTWPAWHATPPVMPGDQVSSNPLIHLSAGFCIHWGGWGSGNRTPTNAKVGLYVKHLHYSKSAKHSPKDSFRYCIVLQSSPLLHRFHNCESLIPPPPSRSQKEANQESRLVAIRETLEWQH